MAAAFEPFFLPGPPAAGGQRFAIHHPPQGTPRGAVLYLHPFAEEMNKSRRMAALGARALAAAGYGVLQLDLLGCGDSSGDFGDATWAHWLDDAELGARWMRERYAGPLWLWGLRAGALLAAETAARIDGEHHLLLWQPAGSGKLLLQQFLRLRMAGQLLDEAATEPARGATDALRKELAAGHAVEIAGYMLAPGLAQGLETATLQAPPSGCRVVWLELSSRTPPALLPASATVVERWRAAGHEVDARALAGPAFWQTTEIEEAPSLLDAMVEAMTRAASAPRELLAERPPVRSLA
ncbi:MAG: hydrolase 2, exosortase A system-associated [Rubrivivax sp.]|nr:hydrolase 2, exosortase A system-associated [Rubrivivax sp.]